MTPQQLQMFTYFQKNSANLNPQQKATFAQLQHQHRLIIQAKQATDSSSPSSSSSSSSSTLPVSSNQSVDSSLQSQSAISRANFQLSSSLSLSLNKTSNDDTKSFNKLTIKLNDQLNAGDAPLNNGTETLDPRKADDSYSNNADESDLNCLLSPKLSFGPVSENLFSEYGLNMHTFKKRHGSISSHSATAISNSALTSKLSDKNAPNKYLTSEGSIHRSFAKCDYQSSPIHLSIDMTASEVIALIKDVGKDGHIHNNLLFEDCRPPSPIPPPYPPLTKKQLSPATPSVFVS